MSASREVVLCLNAGSSSLKFSLFSVDEAGEHELVSASVEEIGRRGPHDHAAALALALQRLEAPVLPRPTLAAHRVVHGGPEFVAPALIGESELSRLRALVKLAPLHLPAALAVLEAVRTRYPELPQVACFDTAFHADMPERSRRLPLPSALLGQGLRRYGFHGLSCESALDRLGKPPPGRVIIAHLGSGSSITAVRDGRSVDTSMGLTPTAGVMTSTRTGDLDPGVLVYLQREEGLGADELERVVNRESGLLAVGGSSDVRELLRKRATEPAAALALEMFVYQVQKVVAGYVAALGGLDVLVFTGGIGEHSSEVRREICAGLAPFGVELDDARNLASCDRIEGEASRVVVRVLPADEERILARHGASLARKALS